MNWINNIVKYYAQSDIKNQYEVVNDNVQIETTNDNVHNEVVNDNIQIDLESFLKSEFSESSPNFLKAKTNLENIISEIGYRKVIRIRGNGNCLISSMITCLMFERRADIMHDLLDEFIEPVSIFNLLNSKNTDPETNSHLLILGEIIRDTINKKWDYPGCPDYHMDDNAIDGLAREMLMRLLCVNELVIYSLKPGINESYKKIIKIDAGHFFKEITPWKIHLICAQGFCHFSSLV